MSITEKQLKFKLEQFVRGKSQARAARELGISPMYLNDILKGRRAITGKKLIKGLGLKAQLIFVKDNNPLIK